MQNKVAIIMALPDESQGLFEQQGIEVHYSGIGKVNAAFKAYDVIHKTGCHTILNLGTAGSTRFDTHELVAVNCFVQRDMDVSALGFPVGTTPLDLEYAAEIGLKTDFTKLRHGICGTGDNFATGVTKVQCDMVDMEGYALAKVCRKLNTELLSVKFISDGANDSAHLDWQDSLMVGAQKLLALYQEIQQDLGLRSHDR